MPCSPGCAERNYVVQRFISRCKKPADIPRRLADSLLVLHKGDTDPAFAVLAETDTWRDGHVGFFD